MSEIKELDRLRKLSKEVVDMRWGVEFDRAVDALEAEIAERYMQLPEDVDGVPIHVGDRLELGSTHGFVISLTYSPENELPWEWQADNGDWYNTKFARHFEPRTLEDVLCDLFERKMSVTDAEREIHDLLGVSA